MTYEQAKKLISDFEPCYRLSKIETRITQKASASLEARRERRLVRDLLVNLVGHVSAAQVDEVVKEIA